MKYIDSYYKMVVLSDEQKLNNKIIQLNKGLQYCEPISKDLINKLSGRLRCSHKLILNKDFFSND